MFRENAIAQNFSDKHQQITTARRGARCCLRKAKPPGVSPAASLTDGKYRVLGPPAARAGIPLGMRVERGLHDPAADDRNDTIRRHAEHFARLELAALVVAHEQTPD